MVDEHVWTKFSFFRCWVYNVVASLYGTLVFNEMSLFYVTRWKRRNQTEDKTQIEGYGASCLFFCGAKSFSPTWQVLDVGQCLEFGVSVTHMFLKIINPYGVYIKSLTMIKIYFSEIKKNPQLSIVNMWFKVKLQPNILEIYLFML